MALPLPLRLQVLHRAVQSYQSPELGIVIEHALASTKGLGYLKAESHYHFDIHSLTGT
jgi:hypothetical protein